MTESMRMFLIISDKLVVQGLIYNAQSIGHMWHEVKIDRLRQF